MADVNLSKVFKYISDNQLIYIQRLADAVACQSVSSLSEKRQDTIDMVANIGKYIEDELHGTVELADLGMQTMPDGSQIKLPPVLLGQIGNDPGKKMILIYGHLDVQPAEKSDGWDTEPFTLTEVDGKLFGRGSTDDKGPVLAVLHAIEAYQKLNIDLPVNVKFVFEGMEESGSVGLDELLESRKHTFLKDVSCTMISDNYWLGKSKPCLTYGLRGIVYFYLEIQCAGRDLHSGLYGGTVYEAMIDLFHLMGSLVNAKGEIQVAGVNEQVAPLTAEELALYDPIEFDIEEYRTDIEAYALTKDTKAGVLMNRWRYPSLSFHGIEKAFSGPGKKTVIPQKVIGKFSIRMVPNMDVNVTFNLVKKHLEDLQALRGSPNPINVRMISGAKPWVADYNHPQFIAGARATKRVYNQEPDLSREGGSIPVTLTLQDTTEQNVMLLPMGCSDDGAHSQNEKINKSNYITGTKLLAAYFEEVAAIDF